MSHFNVVIPMSGQGTRYQAAGYKDPKPLIPVNGIPMIQRLLSKMPLHWKYHFILAENHRGTELQNLLQRLRPGCKIHFIGPHKEGPSFAMRPFLSEIPAQEPVLVSYCDYGMVWDAQAFEDFVLSNKCDACLISYRGFHAHYLSAQNYAFSRLEGERVKEVREKENFTSNRENEFASAGGYYFGSRKILQEAIDFQIENKMEVKGEFYTSLTVQALLKKNHEADVRIFEIPQFFQWGTPQDLKDFEYWERTFQSYNRNSGKSFGPPDLGQILMPMAGFGSRFHALTKKPKPLIEISGQPMFFKAYESLPPAKKTIFVTRVEIVEAMKDKVLNSRIVALSEVPEGQALTTEMGLVEIQDDQDILVSACDHGVVIDPKKWKEFKSLPACDAAIFVIKGFPGVSRKKNSYSYVQATDIQDFSIMKAVSVKQPFTEDPGSEFLLVGTFWFKDKSVLKEGIRMIKDKNIRINNEIYLDSVFTELKAAGKEVRVFELDGYMNWGDPESLKEALYWQEVFTGHSMGPRPSYPSVNF